MRARVWVRGRVRARASATLRSPKAVVCARSGDHAWLCGELQFLQWVLSWLALGLTYSGKYRIPWPNSFGRSRVLGGSNSPTVMGTRMWAKLDWQYAGPVSMWVG